METSKITKNKKQPKVSSDYVQLKRKVGTNSEGKSIYRIFYGNTKREAENKYKESQKKQLFEDAQITRNGGLVPKIFSEWANEWLNVYKYGSVKDITYQTTYEHPTLFHIIPQFGELLLTDIKNADVKRFMNKFRDYSYSEQCKIRLCLYGIFETALDNGFLRSNPAKNISISKTASDRIHIKRAYTYSEARLVIEFAKKHKFGLDIICLLKTGLRRSELTAMPFKFVSDINGGIDMENRLFKVRQSLSESRFGMQLGAPKSKKSIRDIPFSEELFEILQKEPSEIHYVSTDETYKRNYLVYEKKGNYMRPTNWDNRFKVFKKDFVMYCKENNLKLEMYSPHELRHSFGSILYSQGVDIVTISKLMGHESIEITVKTYVHNDISLMQNAIERGI